MLTLQFIPYHDLEDLNSNQKVSKLLKSVRENKIVLVEGKLDAGEEALLIQRTMEEINRSFKGVEICSLDYYHQEDWVKNVRRGLAKMLLGNRAGFTVIGPASLVREIRKDPNKIELLTGNMKRKRK